jgi:hypothetical protein
MNAKMHQKENSSKGSQLVYSWKLNRTTKYQIIWTKKVKIYLVEIYLVKKISTY